MLQIYHNSQCSKSMAACSLLQKTDVEMEVIDYFEKRFTEKSLKAVLKKLRMNPEEIVRKKEPLYLEKYAGKKFTDPQWIKILVKHPELIERPIVVKGNKAIIGRPPERVLNLL
jgi:arsenate reductase